MDAKKPPATPRNKTFCDFDDVMNKNETPKATAPKQPFQSGPQKGPKINLPNTGESKEKSKNETKKNKRPSRQRNNKSV